MNKPVATLVILLGSLFGHAQTKAPFSFQKPPETVSLFQKDVVNTFLNERDFAISPDGNEIFFTVTTPRSSIQTIVYCSKDKSGKWSKPVIAPFAGTYSDLEPAFNGDGSILYFASNRPVEGTEPKDFDIWKVERSGKTWGTPVNIGPVINTTGDEFYPSISKSGNIYFTAAYEGGPGKEDIYVSEFKDETFQKPVPLDTAVNSRFYEFNAYVSPDESVILFTSYGRADDAGGGDLYASFKRDGKWQPARNIKELNSARLDYCPYISPDGTTVFFTSERNALPRTFSKTKATYQDIVDATLSPLNGSGNIYWVDAKVLQKYLSTQ
jgi:Tol biopolymer transport system component